MLIPALGVGAYTILLSWVASTESRPGAFQSRNILTFLLLTVPASSLGIIFLMPITEPLQYISYAVALILCYLWMRLSTLSKHAFLLYDLLRAQAFAEVFEVSTFGLHIYWEP